MAIYIPPYMTVWKHEIERLGQAAGTFLQDGVAPMEASHTVWPCTRGEHGGDAQQWKKATRPETASGPFGKTAKAFQVAQPEEERQQQQAQIGHAAGALARTHLQRPARLVAPDNHPAGARVFGDGHRGLKRARPDGDREAGTEDRRHRLSGVPPPVRV